MSVDRRPAGPGVLPPAPPSAGPSARPLAPPGDGPAGDTGPGADGTPDPWAPVRRVAAIMARAPFTRDTWGRTIYAVCSLPVAAVSFAFVILWTLCSFTLVATFVGLPLLAAGGVAARWFGSGRRGLVRRWLGEWVEPPRPLLRGPGFFGWLQAALRDQVAWRARLHQLIGFPVAVVVGGATLYAWWTAASCVTAPLWWQGQGSGPLLFDFTHATWAAQLLVVLFGLAVLAVTPWLVLGLTWFDALLVRLLVGRGQDPDRVRDLELARAQVAEESAATLRRIERDLHDGTQAQLTSVAMHLGQVKEKLDHRGQVPYDPDGALELATVAHRQVKEALVDLRAIARTIHPPALDVGLDAALATLVARSSVPTSLRVEVPVRPTRAIETITYYSVAELLANVAKHSKARLAEVEIVSGVASLIVRVVDDGVGGARAGGGTGLSGLSDRVRAVDGHLSVTSPEGGPTVVVVELPLHA